MSDQDDNENDDQPAQSFYAEHNYTTSFLHLILCGSAGYALKKTNFSDRGSFTALSILLGHSVLGVIRFGHPQHARKLRWFFDQSLMLSTLLPLPLLNTHLYLKYQPEYPYLAYGNLVASTIPLFYNFIDGYGSTQKVVDIIALGNITSLAYISALNENYWGIGLAFLTGFNHFIVREVADRLDLKVPKIWLLTVGLNFFAIFFVNCLYPGSN